MKRILLTMLLATMLSGCSLLPQKAGIEIITIPTAKVIIDGKEAGMTPYKNNTIKPGLKEIKLQTNEGIWQKNINLRNGVNTVIDREINKDRLLNGGYILTLESTGDKNKAGLMVNSLPDKASVKVDSEIVGMSPLRLVDIGEGDKQITLSLPRHKSINVLIKAIKGYQTIIDADLVEEDIVATETVVNTETKINSEITTKDKWIVIKETGTGWLRIRGQSNQQSAEIGKALTGTKHKVISEDNGYYEINTENGATGWVLAKYVDILSE